MRKLSLFAGILLALFLVGNYAIAAPAADVSNTNLIADDEGDKPQEEKAEEAEKQRKSRSYKEKLEGRSKPKSSGKPKSKPKYKKWSEVLKDSKKHEGLFTVHTKREDVFFEITEEQLDKPHVLFLSLSKGIGTNFVLGGLPISGSVMFDFHRSEDHIQIRQLNTLFRASDDPALDEAIDLTFGNSILFSAPIASENEKSKSLLINMDKLFLSDMSDMGFWLQLSLRKPVRMDPKKGIYRLVQSFPENIEIETLLTYSPGDRRGLFIPSVPDNRYIEIGVHYSIHKLPEEPMTPRVADDRLGYFMTPYKDFSRDAEEDFFVHHINRWRLEKKDPSAAMSEPKEPIVFYLDTTIPKHYRKYVKEGVEIWQKAFEKAGFKNAIIAKDAEGVEDYNAEDARFNTIRWIVSDSPSFGAIGPSRVDPRTGEIIDSDILMEQNMLMGRRKMYRRFAGPAAIIQQLDPMLKHMKDPATDADAALMEEMRRRNAFMATCDIGFGASVNFEFASLAAMMDGGLVDGKVNAPEEFMGEFIVNVTAHEVGHTIGLRHNFKSSVALPYEELHDRYAVSEKGLTGSVMDYAAPNVSRDRSKQGYYYSPSVGTYDQWVIQWGYMEGSDSELDAVAGEAWKKENAYGTDEDTYPMGAIDPRSSIWDLSDNPLAWAKERMGVCRDIFASGELEDRVVGDGEKYLPLRYAVQTLLVQEYIAAARAVKYIGGQNTTRAHRGDHNGDLPVMPISAAEQRDAMNFLVANGFSKTAFNVPPNMLDKLQDDKLWTWQNNLFSYGRRFDFPTAGWVGSLQNALLVQLMNPVRLQVMVDSEYKVSDPYRASEMFRALTDEIWNKNMVPKGRTAVMQRNLQRLYLDKLIQNTVNPHALMPHEAVALSRLHLTRLQARIDQTYAQSGLSDEANAHLLESRARIARALDAKLQSAF